MITRMRMKRRVAAILLLLPVHHIFLHAREELWWWQELYSQSVLIKMAYGRGAANTRVYIGDLGSGGSKPELEREFERYGPLKSVWVARNPPGKLLEVCMYGSC